MARLLALAALFAAPFTASADPLKVDRTLKKEPAYTTKAPRYGLLLFGPEGKDRVWLVHDGDTLYVDRNGNGDLTEPGEAVAAEKPASGQPAAEGEYTFHAGEIAVGGRTHKGLIVSVSQLAKYGAILDHPAVRAALAKDPRASIDMVRVEVDTPGLKGGGLGGRLSYVVGPLDLDGPLQFTSKLADAPVIHLGGPLEITFYSELPSLRVGRSSEVTLVVGTSGVGRGTFAMLSYMDTIPESAKPIVEITYQPAKPGEKPLKELFEIKERC
jgi:hypothetical protein